MKPKVYSKKERIKTIANVNTLENKQAIKKISASRSHFL